MRIVVFMFLALICLAGCCDRVETVPIPVAQPCAKKRPDPVRPLRETVPDWDSLTIRQKSAEVAMQGLKRANYGDALNASTIGCPEIGG